MNQDIRTKLYAIIDEQLVKHPLLKGQREKILKGLLKYYWENGKIPTFTIEEVNEKRAREGKT